MRDRSCAYSFDDLHHAVHARNMTEAQRRRLYAMTQAERNAWVRQMVARTDGGFTCEDRTGSDDQIYTAFWATHRTVP